MSKAERRSQGWAASQRQRTVNTTTATTVDIDYAIDIPSTTTTSTLCANCNERPGTVAYTASGGILDYTHGFYAMWCEVCVTRAQLAYAQERAAAIPDLERKLELLDG